MLARWSAHTLRSATFALDLQQPLAYALPVHDGEPAREGESCIAEKIREHGSRLLRRYGDETKEHNPGGCGDAMLENKGPEISVERDDDAPLRCRPCKQFAIDRAGHRLGSWQDIMAFRPQSEDAWERYVLVGQEPHYTARRRRG